MRTYRLGEFVAHNGAVNCVRIGRDTAGVLATGGEDKKVNLWRTGQTQVVKSLSGLQSSVECVVFGEHEDTIAAGGANGTVKVWDMESGKVSRSLTGHRANCLSLAFSTADTHFLVSGSLDCNAKVWDLRRKEAIVTFKGHQKGVMKVAPSPDNKWVCSGSEDGEIKVWDMQSGRIMRDDFRHNGRITGLEFNQVEFLLVSSGADRTVRVWDLEAWTQVECLGPEATPVQSIAYAPDGSVLLTATGDALKVWGLEPAVHHDTVPTDWRNLADLHLYYNKDNQPRALGCCCSGSSVGVFMVDLRKVAPFCNALDATAAVGIGSGGTLGLQPQGSNSSGRAAAPLLEDYTSSRPVQLQPVSQQQPSRGSDLGLDRELVDRPLGVLSLVSEAAAAGSPQHEAGPLTRQLPRQHTPPRANAPPAGLSHSSSSSNSRQPGFPVMQPMPPVAVRRAGPTQASSAASAVQYHSIQEQQHTQGSDYFPEVEIRVPAAKPLRAPEQAAVSAAPPPAVPPAASRSQQQSRTNGSGLMAAEAAAGGATGWLPSNGSSRRSSGLEPDTAAVAACATLAEPSAAARRQQVLQHDLSRCGSASSPAREPPGALSSTLADWLKDNSPRDTREPCSKSSSRASSIPASRVPSRRDMSALPMQQQQQQDKQQQQQQPVVPGPAAAGDPIVAAMAARPQLKLELALMVSVLQVAKGFVGRGNLEGAYKAAVSQGDAAVACMLLEAVSGRPDAFELSSLEPLLKLLELLLSGVQEQQVAVGLSVLSLVLRGPGQTIHDVCSAPKPVGVDLSFEARHSRCLLLKMGLEGLGLKVGVLTRRQGPVGTRARLLAEELKRIISAGA